MTTASRNNLLFCRSYLSKFLISASTSAQINSGRARTVPQSTSLLEIADRVQQDLAIETDQLIPFLSALELGHDLGSIIKKMKVGERVVTNSIKELHELGQESTLIFFGPEVERELSRRLGIKPPTRSIRFKRLVPGSRLLHDQEPLRELARSFDHWPKEDIARLIRCARKRFEDLNSAEVDAADRAKRLLSRGCSLADAAWVAALTLASQASRRSIAPALP